MFSGERGRRRRATVKMGHAASFVSRKIGDAEFIIEVLILRKIFGIDGKKIFLVLLPVDTYQPRPMPVGDKADIVILREEGRGHPHIKEMLPRPVKGNPFFEGVYRKIRLKVEPPCPDVDRISEFPEFRVLHIR